MVDSQNSLWLAKYNVKVSSLPNSFALPNEFEALRNKTIKPHTFQKELEIISRYADSEEESAKAKTVEKESLDGGADMTAAILEAEKAAEVTTSSHSEIVAQMVQKTKQESDVCYFYLESVGWDLDSAIELLNSMEAK